MPKTNKKKKRRRKGLAGIVVATKSTDNIKHCKRDKVKKVHCEELGEDWDVFDKPFKK